MPSSYKSDGTFVLCFFIQVPTEVSARHILMKHKGSRRPSSWQDPTGAAIKQRFYFMIVVGGSCSVVENYGICQDPVSGTKFAFPTPRLIF